MKSLNSFFIFRSSRPNLQSSYISHDCRLTVGSPSGMTAKLQVNSFMRFAVFLTLIFTLGVGNVWAESYDQTIPYATLNSEKMLGGSYADANSYYKVPASSNNTATINIPSSYFNHTPTGDVTIILSLATFGTGTDPSTSNTTITATGTETSSTWNTSSYSGTLPSSSTYNNITLTLSKVASPTTLSGVTISIHIYTGVKILRLQSVRIQYEYSSTPATITLSEAGVSTNVSGTHYSGESYTLPSSTEATCGTKVLVGWSTIPVTETDTKPTSNFYEKGETVTLSTGENKFYAVFATNSGSVEAKIGIGTNNSGVSGTYSDLDFTVNNIRFKTSQWMKSTNIQAKKDQTYSLYNVDAIPANITKIVVKQTGTARAVSMHGSLSSS